jgi:hypothetical protein
MQESQHKMIDMVRVLMLAPYYFEGKEFLQNKTYSVERKIAQRMTLCGAAKIVDSDLGGFENKQI